MSDHSEAQRRALRIGRSRTGAVINAVGRCLVRVLAFPFFRTRVYGAAALSTPGPLLVAPVHRSNLDAPMIAGAGNRRLWALSKESLLEVPVLRWFIAALGGFPVRRGTADRLALTSAQELLTEGEAIIVFPEGSRQIGPEVTEVYDGVAFLAARAGATVVPVAIAGTDAALPGGARWPRRVQVVVNVGRPIPPPDTGGGRLTLRRRREFSADLRERLQLLYDEARADAELPL